MWRDALGQGEVITSESTVGGGSLPDECSRHICAGVECQIAG